MTQPLVAVVTPVYNGEPHLKHTLRCVQAQTYPNLVHVVLDNASTDDTPEQIRAAEGGRVPIQAHRNDKLLPQVENWNAALALCPPEAKYVQFLAADDLIRSDAIEKLVEAAEAAMWRYADRFNIRALDEVRSSGIREMLVAALSRPRNSDSGP